VDSAHERLIGLGRAGGFDTGLVGGKARTLARLASEGFPVCPGFVVTTQGYLDFIAENRLAETLEMELYRKDLEGMRWEEIWDSALRVRTRFLGAAIPGGLRKEILAAAESLGKAPLAVRSSAPGEDGAQRSFAGLHESYVDVTGQEPLLDAVRLVWASLWSDASLLYRRELGLKPRASAMAVLVQTMRFADRSGVAFARDPRDLERDLMLIEAVPGLCKTLVDGEVDPDHWEVERSSRVIQSWRPGAESPDDPGGPRTPLLRAEEIRRVTDVVLEVEEFLDYPPDMEWTGRGEDLTVLQARPITAPAVVDPDREDRRGWYLSLRPGDVRLRELRSRVVGDLIPRLEEEGARLASEDLASFGDAALVAAIEARRSRLEYWMKVYWEDFIPFAHGVRRLGVYYNDAVRPADPYEFVTLLRDQPLLAVRRNQKLAACASLLGASPELLARLDVVASQEDPPGDLATLGASLSKSSGAVEFLAALEEVCSGHLDVTYAGRTLGEDLPGLLVHLLERARCGSPEQEAALSQDSTRRRTAPDPERLRQRLLEAVGPERRTEALELLELGRVSWRIRDDDNLLVGKIESQLLRALEEGARRLTEVGRWTAARPMRVEDSEKLVEALRDPAGPPLELVRMAAPGPRATGATSATSPRQLLGQPAAPGLATGTVRRVLGPEDLPRVKKGDIVVCDAIEPAMTHVVPLAGAIVERRGGMLIHGAIIARELGIPCVNGVEGATARLVEGQLVTVDGYLGLVTVGPPSFDLERGEIEGGARLL
jgi:pyruvate,water dikinase